MPFSELEQHIVKTLLYYEIFDHPLSADELFLLLPKNSLSKDAFLAALRTLTIEGKIAESRNYYSLPGKGKHLAELRLTRERLAQRRLKIARRMSEIIRRFPFVRGIFISGDLSKGVAHPDSDIDYVIITEPGRLWICRTMLMLFKKTFLLNSKKYFCLNYYVSTNSLLLQDQNYYTATEIAHVKPLYNERLFLEFVETNNWIRRYFPNFHAASSTPRGGHERRSSLQRLMETLFPGRAAESLDVYLMSKMKRVWDRRYSHYPDALREQLFRCTRGESRAFAGNFEGKILDLYRQKLEQYHLA